MVPGAFDELIAVRKKAPKAAAKHVTELPVIPNYEYQLPVDSKDKQADAQLSAEELKVRAPLRLNSHSIMAAFKESCKVDGWQRRTNALYLLADLGMLVGRRCCHG